MNHRGINQKHLMLTGLLLLAAAPSFLQADVYKWVDNDGVVTFTNIAPPSNQQYQVLKFPCYASDPKCRSLNWKKVPLNTSSYRSEIHGAAQFNAVDESLIRAIIHAESAYQPDAQSPRGAQGLMQLMPETQRKLKITDPFNPASNIEGGTRYLADLLLEFNGDISLAAAAYNAGPTAVHKYGGIPPYDETREYVKRVKILYQRYQNL